MPMQMPMPMPMPFIGPQPPPGPPLGPPMRPNNPVQAVSSLKPSIERLNNIQLLVNQQQNIFTERWEDFSPRELIKDNIAFIIFSRSQRSQYVPKTVYILEIVSDALKRILKECDCLRYVESMFDPSPQVPS